MRIWRLVEAGLLDKLGNTHKKEELRNLTLWFLLPELTETLVGVGGWGPIKTTSPRIHHPALSSEDGFVLHRGENMHLGCLSPSS